MPQQTNSSEVKLAAPILPKYDYLLHASGMSLETLQLHVIPTATFVSTFKDFLSTLLDIIREQGKQLEFDGYYISYLLGNITEEEFQEIAKGFVTETRETPFNVLKDKVRVLNALRGQDLSIREMAQYLYCSEDDIVRALQLLQG
jgi:hypothetical protein